MSDVLAALTPQALAGFYRRLADKVDANRGALETSFAAVLLRQWLDNRDAKAELVIDVPKHVRDHAMTKQGLAYHRAVYLTEEKARLGPGVTKWAGIIPRLQGIAPHTAWDLKRPLSIDYQSLIEIPLRYQITGNDADRDILYALHGYQLKSFVTVAGVAQHGTSVVKITFQSFEAEIRDRYDWDYSEHLTVPNPDYKSTDKAAVSPNTDTVVVYHKHAKRLEDAGLAAPYDFRSNRFRIADAALTAAAQVDAKKALR